MMIPTYMNIMAREGSSNKNMVMINMSLQKQSKAEEEGGGGPQGIDPTVSPTAKTSRPPQKPSG